jgi:hypothetical protein
MKITSEKDEKEKYIQDATVDLISQETTVASTDLAVTFCCLGRSLS